MQAERACSLAHSAFTVTAVDTQGTRESRRARVYTNQPAVSVSLHGLFAKEREGINNARDVIWADTMI